MAKRKPKQREWSSPIELQLRNAIVGQASHVETHDIRIYDFSTSTKQAACVVDGQRVVGLKDEDDWDLWNVAKDYFEYGGGGYPWCLYGSVLIATYKIDLLLADDESGSFVAIECDGHEWHDRTKQQASSDRARDRELLRLGVPTLRFTGSDIHHDSTRCAVDVIETAKAIRERSAVTARENGNIDGYLTGFERGTQREKQYQTHRGIFAGSLSELG